MSRRPCTCGSYDLIRPRAASCNRRCGSQLGRISPGPGTRLAARIIVVAIQSQPSMVRQSRRVQLRRSRLRVPLADARCTGRFACDGNGPLCHLRGETNPSRALPFTVPCLPYLPERLVGLSHWYIRPNQLHSTERNSQRRWRQVNFRTRKANCAVSLVSLRNLDLNTARL